jgi:transketolase
MRSAFVNVLVEAARADDRVWMITPDLGYNVLEPFMDEFPDRFVNAGIAEQNAVGVAAGLALSGKMPFVYSIAPFVYARPFEQVRVDVAYQNLPVRLVGVGGGLSYGALGATHHSTEDLAVMRALPNMEVLAPGCVNEADAAARWALNRPAPMYIRLGKKGGPDLGYAPEFGRLHQVSTGARGALIATSTMLASALDLAQRHGLALYSAHTIKPFDNGKILDLARADMPLVTLEEHSIIGGLASCVSDALARNKLAAKFLPIAIPDKFSHIVGSAEYIRERIGLGGLDDRIKEFLRS